MELLEARSLPLRNYLMKYVVPSLTDAILDCCKIKVEDPVDFLVAAALLLDKLPLFRWAQAEGFSLSVRQAEHLLRNNQWVKRTVGRKAKDQSQQQRSRKNLLMFAAIFSTWRKGSKVPQLASGMFHDRNIPIATTSNLKQACMKTPWILWFAGISSETHPE